MPIPTSSRMMPSPINISGVESEAVGASSMTGGAVGGKVAVGACRRVSVRVAVSGGKVLVAVGDKVAVRMGVEDSAAVGVNGG